MTAYSSSLRREQAVAGASAATATTTATATATATAEMADWVSLVGRLALAALFLWSGYGKLVSIDGNVAYMQAVGLPAAGLLIWVALLVELLGGAMLLTGWRARWAAAVLALFTVVATFLFHAYWNAPADQALNQQIHFMKNIAIIGGLLVVVAHGAGRYALGRK
jgi:putative oxidoreductase